MFNTLSSPRTAGFEIEGVSVYYRLRSFHGRVVAIVCFLCPIRPALAITALPVLSDLPVVPALTIPVGVSRKFTSQDLGGEGILNGRWKLVESGRMTRECGTINNMCCVGIKRAINNKISLFVSYQGKEQDA